MASEQTKLALRDELEVSAGLGAGLVELLDELERRNRRLGRRNKLSKEELEELSLYCWTLQTNKPSELVWDRAHDLWESFKTRTRTPRPRPGERPPASG